MLTRMNKIFGKQKSSTDAYRDYLDKRGVKIWLGSDYKPVQHDISKRQVKTLVKTYKRYPELIERSRGLPVIIMPKGKEVGVGQYSAHVDEKSHKVSDERLKIEQTALQRKPIEPISYVYPQKPMGSYQRNVLVHELEHRKQFRQNPVQNLERMKQGEEMMHTYVKASPKQITEDQKQALMDFYETNVYPYQPDEYPSNVAMYETPERKKQVPEQLVYESYRQTIPEPLTYVPKDINNKSD